MIKHDHYYLKNENNINFTVSGIILSVSIIIFSIYTSYYLSTFIHILILITIIILLCFLILELFTGNELLIGFLIIFLAIAPSYQKMFPYNGFVYFDIFDISLELFFVFILIILFLSKKVIYIKTRYKKILKGFNYIIILWIITNIFSTLFSIDIYRSFLLFIIGVLGPAFVFYIITSKTKVNYRIFNFLLLSLISSGIVTLLYGFFIRFRYQYIYNIEATLNDLRTFGSNSEIGVISFVMPFIFVNTIESDNKYVNKLVLSTFRILSIWWIIVALSRWGYFTFFIAFILTFFLDRGNNKKYYYFIIFFLIFVLLFTFSNNIIEMIIYRFSGGDIFKIDYIIGKTIEDLRWQIWENAFKVIKKNIFFGVGIGNHPIISPLGTTSAHNMFINILVERGILTCLIFIGIIIFFYRACFKFRKLSNNYQLKKISLMLSLGITTFIIWSLIGGPLIISTIYIYTLRSYYFFYIIALQLYIIKLDAITGSKI